VGVVRGLLEQRIEGVLLHQRAMKGADERIELLVEQKPHIRHRSCEAVGVVLRNLARRAQWPHGALQLFVSGQALLVEIELAEPTPVGSVEPFPVGGIMATKTRTEMRNRISMRAQIEAENVMPFLPT
jgi:hypothetical protein